MALLDYIAGLSHSASTTFPSPASQPETGTDAEPVSTIDESTEPTVTGPESALEPQRPAMVESDSVPVPTVVPVSDSTLLEPIVTSAPHVAVDEPLPTPAPEPESKQAPVAIDAPATETVPTPEEVKETLQTNAPAPEEVAATTVVEPLADNVNKQPTVTHAEAGTAHTEVDPATKVDGTLADQPVEEAAPATTTEEAPKPVETEKEEKKTPVKEKAEKTKSEGKGFFAKLFGNKEKSPKKEKKVKTPKTEKADPIAEAAAAPTEASAAPVAESSEAPAASVAAPIEPTPAPIVETPAPVVETAPVVAEAPKDVEAPAVATDKAVETPAPTAEETAREPKEEASKPNLKAHRRLSARITDIFKIKKTHGPPSPKEETPKEGVKATEEETPAAPVSDEAPKLEKPVTTEPLKLEEEQPKPTAQAPAAPIVAASA